MVETQPDPLAESDKQPQSKQAPETYKKVKVLGKGSFGKAFLVKCGSDGVSTFNWKSRGLLNRSVAQLS